MHLKRWLTSIVAVPILIYLIGFSPRWLFYFFLYLVSFAGLNELYKIIYSEQPIFLRWTNYSINLLLFITIYTRQILYLPIIIVLSVFIPLIYCMFTFPSQTKKKLMDTFKPLFGSVYITFPLMMMILIDMRPNGRMWIFFLLTVIFATDTGAFYFGKLLGKHKLYREVSPNKTWEGAIGGTISSLLVASAFLWISGISKFGMNIIFLVLAISIFGQVGDLVESMIKRIHEIKDSGNILPGHGGILDRIDSLLFAIPTLYLFLLFII